MQCQKHADDGNALRMGMPMTMMIMMMMMTRAKMASMEAYGELQFDINSINILCRPLSRGWPRS